MLSEDRSRLPAGSGPGRGVTLSVVERAVPRMFADSVTSVLAPTFEVLTGKLALKAPAGTLTLAGTCAADALPLDKGTDSPPAGAAAARVNLPLPPAPAETARRVPRFSASA